MYRYCRRVFRDNVGKKLFAVLISKTCIFGKKLFLVLLYKNLSTTPSIFVEVKQLKLRLEQSKTQWKILVPAD